MRICRNFTTSYSAFFFSGMLFMIGCVISEFWVVVRWPACALLLNHFERWLMRLLSIIFSTSLIFTAHSKSSGKFVVKLVTLLITQITENKILAQKLFGLHFPWFIGLSRTSIIHCKEIEILAASSIIRENFFLQVKVAKIDGCGAIFFNGL